MPSEWLICIAIFARFLGFFLISPIFSRLPTPSILRFGLACALTVLFAPVIATTLPETPPPLSIWVLKEALIGILLGLIFSLLFEVTALAGQIVGVLSGVSATEILSPSFSSGHPLGGRLYTLLGACLFFSLDLHHALLHVLKESFSWAPLHTFSFSRSFFKTFVECTDLYARALTLAAFPFFGLLLLILFLAILSKMIPEIPIFWTGLPLQFIIGTGLIFLSLYHFPEGFSALFQSLSQCAERIFLDLRRLL